MKLIEKTWNHTGIQKNATFLKVRNKPIIYKFFKYFTNHRKKPETVVLFSVSTFPNILKCKDHRCDFPTICKTRFNQTHNESLNESSDTQLFRTNTGIQSGSCAFDDSCLISYNLLNQLRNYWNNIQL